MIGNDIIDINIAAIESNPLRPGFQEKIFSKSEQVIVNNSPDPVLQIWILWAMKESAYKAHQRRFNLERKLNPHNLQCIIEFQDQTLITGKVNIASETYYVHCDLNINYIHCAATSNKDQKVYNKILPHSEDLKNSLFLKLSSIYKFPPGSLSLVKNRNSIPFITTNKETLQLPFSLSHHGKYQAFSLPLMNY